jgi:hypothetical protein
MMRKPTFLLFYALRESVTFQLQSNSYLYEGKTHKVTKLRNFSYMPSHIYTYISDVLIYFTIKACIIRGVYAKTCNFVTLVFLTGVKHCLILQKRLHSLVGKNTSILEVNK